ncbi:helix-turn-helix transcriptional regulator [Yersinia massiliensis]|uniref:Rha family transcriptional regulator n=1 Tax=Yersinia massiliensis TaxID=419257 RepID=A0ABM6UMX2_9GAMM|nr:AlpA family phage regulatory protein [Yersinia massiliensis]AVX36249.1 Rha family transcriptional regulator [Yersinia massiliensis]QKJ11056.1 AlpA family phage regulatory protein [Yersinia massiliensis]
MSMIDIHNDKFVDMVFITTLIGLSDKWFYKMAQEGKFPKPVKFGRSSRWIEREVKEWLEERIKSSRA